ncbi:MAG: NAD(P)/FAD-dependent oxidoreductase [Thermomicrobia bacterium]|nr:NAD(P)/FAD-dependent oxidoreductase [Thermomicrobia bacterium]
MTRYDAIVVGSGPNGLSAAITLAEHGRAVLVLEAAPSLGGAVVTEELTLPGFRHDTFSAVYPAGAASPVFARMPLAHYGLCWIHPPIAMVHPFLDGRAVAFSRDINRTVDSLDRLTPGDGQAWRTFITPYLTQGAAVRQTLLSGFPPLAGGLRLLGGLRVGGALEFTRLLLLSADTLAAERFRGDAARAWLYGAAMHADVPPWEAGSAIAAFYLLFLGHLAGWPSPKGGAGSLTAALTGYLAYLGGQTRTETTAARVIVASGRSTGVITEAGETIHAPIVIGDLTPHGLIRLAGHALPAAYVARLARFRYGPGTCKVDWALDGPVPWTATAARSAGTVHVGGETSAMTAALTQQREGILPEWPFLLVGQQSLADPTRAPMDKQTAWAYTHVPDGINWMVETERFVERIEAQIERFAPGFRDRILARHVLAPPGFAARNRNLIGGDVGGGSSALDQLLFRPIPSLSPYRTPIGGLYLGSASTFPGAGVNGIAGDAAARRALRDTRFRSLTRRK